MLLIALSISTDVYAQRGSELLPKPPEGYKWKMIQTIIGEDVDKDVRFYAEVVPIPIWEQWFYELFGGGFIASLAVLASAVTYFKKFKALRKKHGE